MNWHSKIIMGEIMAQMLWWLPTVFQLNLRSTLQEERHACYSKSGQEPQLGELIGPRRKFTTIILLNGPIIKLFSKFISLYQQIGEILRHHQKKIFGRWMVTQKLTNYKCVENKFQWKARQQWNIYFTVTTP